MLRCWPVIFSFINLDFERDDALAHRFENHTVLFHLVETGEQFAGDLLELVFSVVLSADQS